MNTILLEPTDVLFFRDGRPMSGASSGHGAAWPLPNVINHAFHAALHRAEIQGVHEHRRGRSGNYSDTRDRKFGSLVSAGPFPERDGTWYFPRPADADDTCRPVLFPCQTSGPSSLPQPCRYPVVSSIPPSKQSLKPWWSAAAWQKYLDPSASSVPSDSPDLCHDSDFCDTEHAYGIGISPDTGSVEEGAFYSAHYLRLRAGWKLGVFATAPDKDFQHNTHGSDLVRTLLNGHGAEILAGGQQRVCTATLAAQPGGCLPLPLGNTTDFAQTNSKHLVKWALLTPAIFPQIGDHPGGSLPSWINHQTGDIELLDGPGKNAAARRKVTEGKPIPARLVAALVGKSIPVTGYALPNSADPDRTEGGAKPTHLAVPAGSVYYFECESEDAAKKLAAALNWHGADISHLQSDPPHPTIRNRRSALMGEKGFGLGVCGTWEFIKNQAPT